MARGTGARDPRPRLLALLAAVVAVGGLAGCVSAREPTASPRPTATKPGGEATPLPTGQDASPLPGGEDGALYVALGDSVTYGIGAPDPLRQGFPARVARRLRGAAEPIVDLRVVGVPGETAAGFLDRWLDDVIETFGSTHDVGLVTVGLGANEVLRAQRSQACRTDRTSGECRSLVAESSEGAAVALDSVVARLQEALARVGSDARILLLAYYNPDPDPLAAEVMAGSDGAVTCDAGEARPGLDDRIACIAASREVELVDLYAAFLGRERQLTHIAEGDVHPTVDGYRVIADEIVQTYRASQP